MAVDCNIILFITRRYTEVGMMFEYKTVPSLESMEAMWKCSPLQYVDQVNTLMTHVFFEQKTSAYLFVLVVFVIACVSVMTGALLRQG